MIYITTYDFDVGESSGVVKKIREQIKVFSQNGFEVDYFFTSGKEKVLYLVGKKRKNCQK